MDVIERKEVLLTLMKIIEITSKTFWKGEVGVSGIVEEDEKQYRVNLEVKGNQIYGYSCSCVRGNSYKGMCDHAKALFELYQEQEKSGSNKLVTTSSQVRMMIREYTNREVSQIRIEQQQQSIEVIPRLIAVKNEIELELFLRKQEQRYVVRDLFAFAEAVQQGTYIEYGKKLAFHHELSVFSAASQRLVLFVMEVVNGFREAMGQFRKNSFATIPALRMLRLSQSKRDQFFELVKGTEILWQNGSDSEEIITVMSATPSLKLEISKYGRDGVMVLLERSFLSFAGEQYLYLKKDRTLYRCDQEASRELAPFIDQMTQSNSSPYEIQIQNRDMPLFYERVIKKIQPYVGMQVKGLELEQFEPEKLKVEFYFDSKRKDQVTMTPTLTYGEYSFHPVDDVKVPRSICRDVPKEFKISQLITKYFSYREHDNNDLVIQDDNLAIYQLLVSGIAEFQQLGDVFLSEGFKCLRILPPPQIDMKVKTSYQWLDLTLEVAGMEREELIEILSKYKQKTSYHRLKNGEFVRLDDEGLMTVLQIIDRFQIEGQQLRESSLRIPKYRALYLDALYKKQNSISFSRDQTFKAMIREMKSIEDSDFNAPAPLRNILRHYQLTGYRWLKTLDAYGFGGILADDMGLGKTLQVIAVLLEESLVPEQKSVSLVVCPASLVYNWEHEIAVFAPSLKTATVSGNVKEREAQIASAGDYDVLITSYDLLKRDLSLYQDIIFRYQIIDEAQAIKNAATLNAKTVKTIQAKCKFALTGTPIENHLGELWSIFDYLMPGFLYTYQKFKKEIEIPVVKQQDQDVLKHLHHMVNPFIMRRLKKDVLTELPDKLEFTTYSKMEEEQHQLYLANVTKLKEMLTAHSSQDYSQNKLQVLAELTKLRQICCDPKLCYHNYRGQSAKLESCMELLENGVSGGHKILLFSQFTSMLEIIEERLKKVSIGCYKLTGSTSKENRIQMVQQFQKDQIPVFLISLKAGGTGLNLTAADMVIHYDPWWNVAVQNQATDRAHRIGQQKQVSVFQLITKETIEEQILKLQQQKKQLADQVITEGVLSLSSLTKDELLMLLEA